MIGGQVLAEISEDRMRPEDFSVPSSPGRYEMRHTSTVTVFFVLSLFCFGPLAWGLSDNSAALAALQDKADQAQPRDQCFLYAELVSRMGDLAGQQFNSGDSVQATKTLGLLQLYADKIQMGVADDSKRLKNAETLIRRTSFRLKDILHEVSYEDQPALEATVKRLNEIQTRLMMLVFRK
jgi:hypothetical protein